MNEDKSKDNGAVAKRDRIKLSLTDDSEAEPSLRSQFVTLKKGGRGQHSRYLPYAFTEQGIGMLSAVLHSDTAIDISPSLNGKFNSQNHAVRSRSPKKPVLLNLFNRHGKGREVYYFCAKL
jgi:hypothetical protein